MSRILFNLLLLVAVCLSLPACNWPLGENTALADQDVINTAVAQTVEASGGEAAATNTPEAGLPATDTPQPGAIDATTTETQTPTITVTVTSSVPMIHSTRDTNCRYGPGVVYAVVGYLLTTDAPVEVRGRLEGGGWWYIQNPRYPTQSCWVWDDTTVVEGNTSYLPFITPPPTPTPTATPMPSYVTWADPANYTGACPVTITLYATITVAGPVTITYYWEDSGHTPTPASTVTFATAGSQTVHFSFPATADLSSWVIFRISSPISLTSSHINIVTDCVP